MATRHAALDVLRGIAILGTLATNVWIFTNPEGLIGYIQGAYRATGSWAVAEDLLQQLAQGKFLGLLTIMFGIGLAIQQRSAVRRGRPWPGRYYWRAALLFVDGVINYFLFTEFDVLMGYAVTGLIVAYLLSMRLRRQYIAIAIATSTHLALLGLLSWALLAAPAASSPGAGLSPNPYADGSFVDLVAFRAENFLMFRAEVLFILPMSIALFLIGAALLRAGVLEPRGVRLRRRLMAVGLGIALPLDFAVGLAGGDAGLVVGRYGLAPVVALGLLAWVAGYYADGRSPGRCGRALTPVGRMALSCYVLQNAIAGAVCYGWGLGLAQHLDGSTLVPATVSLYLGIAVVLMLFSRFWLSRFERGPLEWLWHRSYDRITTSADRRMSPERVDYPR
ncbi:DUF418 domain-containing protein [Gordonia sp. UCD-TK1]|uniref:DUF418 domain-containing protein n=1 Tax=Gordonia sp. UCD-TK1 TaxID=1857893 RepID=UPI00080EDFF5|nr:DUF418 domain-containing protein [Gordonia sp. UCD-TK1]OCH81833.1 hypothetical protein A9310_03960 [Gordonia sp. UCD-TK1]